MLIGVPQFIDIEDKIAGPLTAKHLFWMFGMGATVLVMWFILEAATFWVAVFPVGGIFIAFAFYRPYNQTLAELLMHSISFVFRPKIYVWKRIPEPFHPTVSKKENSPKTRTLQEQIIPEAQIVELAKLLDTEGFGKSSRNLEIIQAAERRRGLGKKNPLAGVLSKKLVK
jgi:hypothetical protein